MSLPPKVTAHYTLKNYATVFSRIDIRWIFNTLVLTIIVVVGSIIISVLGGYGLYLEQNKTLETILLASIVIPRYAIVIPQFLIIRYMGLTNTLLAAGLPLLVTPMHLLLAKTFFEQFPKSLIDAARVDGLSRFGALFRIILPESKHLIVALAVLKAVEAWGDFLWQYVVLSKTQKKTLSLGLISWIQNAGGSDVIKINPVGLSLTISVIMAIPFIVVYAAGSKYFIYELGGIE
ncbi:MAG: carbohydrate ABC transporter permease [Phycisphaerae bacterium]|nr:carbohydrate ABC transporter permease [Phycisphaerae bacterium]